MTRRRPHLQTGAPPWPSSPTPSPASSPRRRSRSPRTRARAEGRGPRHHQPLGRRARLRHAREHPRRRQGGDRPRRDPLHRARGHPRAPPRHRRQVRPREPPRLRPRPGHRLDRRQAGAVQRAARHASTPATRWSIPAPYWVSYPDMVRARRRHAGRSSTGRSRHGFKITPRGARRGDHPADQVADLQLAVEPDRRRLLARPSCKALTDVLLAPPAGLGDDRRHVRAHRLPALRLRHPRRGRAAAPRAHAHRQRRLQGLRDDRLAHRLRRRAASR